MAGPNRLRLIPASLRRMAWVALSLLCDRLSSILQVIVNDIPGQEVEFDLYDKDVDKDDFLGR